MPDLDMSSYAIIVIMSLIVLLVLLSVVLTSYITASLQSRRFRELLGNTDHFGAVKGERSYLEKQTYKLLKEYMRREDEWREMNHLLIDAQRNVSDLRTELKEKLGEHGQVILTNFLKQHGLKRENLRVENDFVLVLTPFLEDFNSQYMEIKEVLQNRNFRCLRGDEKFGDKYILPHILGLMVKARFVVANITGRSPSVFYELGIAHAMDKDVIIVQNTQDFIEKDTPIDIRTKLIVLYKNREQLEEKLSKALFDLGLKL